MGGYFHNIFNQFQIKDLIIRTANLVCKKVVSVNFINIL
jgi:hypothetical protein